MNIKDIERRITARKKNLVQNDQSRQRIKKLTIVNAEQRKLM